MERNPKRRQVVTRSRYLHIMSQRYALLSMTGILLSLGMLGIVGSAIGFLTLALTGSDILNAGEWFTPLFILAGFSQLMYSLGRVSARQMKRWAIVIPLTNETAVNLPLNETLVRMPQPHNNPAELLQPAPSHSEIPNEQLLRVS